MMNINKLTYFIIIILSIVSCTTTYKKYSSNKVKDAFIVNSSPTFKGYYYQGSDNDFHYFISKWKWHKNKYFKLAKEELKVIDNYDFNLKELKVDLIKTDNKFGSNKFYKLYVAK